MKNNGDLWGKVFFLGLGLGFWAKWFYGDFGLEIYGLIFGRMGITGFWEYGFTGIWAKILGLGFRAKILGLVFGLGVWAWDFGLRFWANGFHRLVGQGVPYLIDPLNKVPWGFRV